MPVGSRWHCHPVSAAVPRARAPWLVARDSRGAPGRLRARGQPPWRPAGLARGSRDGGAPCERVVRPAPSDTLPSAVRAPSSLAPGRCQASRLTAGSSSAQRGRWGPRPAPAPSSSPLGKRNQPSDRFHLRVSFRWQVLLRFPEPQHFICKMGLIKATLLKACCEGYTERTFSKHCAYH